MGASKTMHLRTLRGYEKDKQILSIRMWKYSQHRLTDAQKSVHLSVFLCYKGGRAMCISICSSVHSHLWEALS